VYFSFSAFIFSYSLKLLSKTIGSSDKSTKFLSKTNFFIAIKALTTFAIPAKLIDK